MPALQVRDCPQDTYDALKRRAARENRSMSQQALTLIQGGLAHREPSPRAAAPLPEGAYREGGITFIPNPAAAHKSREERHAAFLKSISEGPKFELPPEYDSVADLVHAAREERW